MLVSGRVTLEHYADLLPLYIRQAFQDRPKLRPPGFGTGYIQRRHFNDYFVTHLPSSSLHPDSRSGTSSANKLPRKDSQPHQSDGRTPPAAAHPAVSRDTTVVRIPLKSAKHHFGACVSRGSRPYNEDAHQAGVIALPAFAKRPPKSITDKNRRDPMSAYGANGDPQVFYFGVFDGHGGAECSDYLRETLHQYIERTAGDFRLQSSLQEDNRAGDAEMRQEDMSEKSAARKALNAVEVTDKKHAKPAKEDKDAQEEHFHVDISSAPPLIQEVDHDKVETLEHKLIKNWKELVGGYFRRFKPQYFSIYEDYQTEGEKSATLAEGGQKVTEGAAIEEVLMYAFLKADYDFVASQVTLEAESKDHVRAEKPINDEDHILGSSPKASEGVKPGRTRFRGGSTCSVVMVSTPTPTPFWNPATTSSMMIAHVGDTRVILCSTSTGAAAPLTTDHHPSAPIEANRLRKYAATFVTDSFGEERISGLANTRAFGDIGSKRIGVSAEPEIRRVEIGAAEYSFMVLVSDGVSGTLSDQEVVDVVKEAKTPEQASRDVVSFATEVSHDGDNATCLVVRLGGWERRQEGGYGSLGTREARDFKRQEALDPRSSRR